MAGGRVVLAMSGGVDSSVSAHLLVDQGYEVIGLFMRTGVHQPDTCDVDAPPAAESKTKGCCSAVDAADARRVADRLDIPFHALDFSEDFGRIKDYFADEYERGRTPNPCVVCNTWLKFGRLWDYARALGADFIATGHYARRLDGPEGAELHRGLDPSKDQAYFLAGLKREILKHVLFPIGHLPKSEVRRLAGVADLGVEQKPDSQEICFVPTGAYQDFLDQHRPGRREAPGRIVEIGPLRPRAMGASSSANAADARSADDGGAGRASPAGARVVGQHEGLSRFTIGQRKGLGVALGEPRYVLRIEPATREVVIGPRELLSQPTLEAERINWLTAGDPTGPIRAEVQIRHRHAPAAATVEPTAPGRALVRFEEPQSAITPGQAVVFFRGTRALGGGWIA